MLKEAQEANTSTEVIESRRSVFVQNVLIGNEMDNVHLTSRQDGLAVAWDTPQTPDPVGVCMYWHKFSKNTVTID